MLLRYRQSVGLAGLAVFLAPHSLHHTDDLAGVCVDDSRQFFDGQVAVSLQLKRHSFSFRGAIAEGRVPRNHNVWRDRKINAGQRLRGFIGNDLADFILLIER